MLIQIKISCELKNFFQRRCKIVLYSLTDTSIVECVRLFICYSIKTTLLKLSHICETESGFLSRDECRGSDVESRGSNVEGKKSRVEGKKSRVTALYLIKVLVYHFRKQISCFLLLPYRFLSRDIET